MCVGKFTIGNVLHLRLVVNTTKSNKVVYSDGLIPKVLNVLQFKVHILSTVLQTFMIPSTSAFWSLPMTVFILPGSMPISLYVCMYVCM